jgi:hypothetical protein
MPSGIGFLLAHATLIVLLGTVAHAADTRPPPQVLKDWYRKHLVHPAWHDPAHELQILARTGLLAAERKGPLLQALSETRPKHDIGAGDLKALHSSLSLEPGARRVAVLEKIEEVLATGERPDDPSATLAACRKAIREAGIPGVTEIGVPRPPTSRHWWIAHQVHNSAMLGVHGDLLHLTPARPLRAALIQQLGGHTDELDTLLRSDAFEQCSIPVWWQLGRVAPHPTDHD